eukprot:365611-Chlamydomonas_euryale.AAC.15
MRPKNCRQLSGMHATRRCCPQPDAFDACAAVAHRCERVRVRVVTVSEVRTVSERNDGNVTKLSQHRSSDGGSLPTSTKQHKRNTQTFYKTMLLVLLHNCHSCRVSNVLL